MNDKNGRTFSNAILALCAIIWPLLIWAGFRAVRLDIVLAFFEPVLAIIFIPASLICIIFAAFSSGREKLLRLSIFSLLFWIWLTVLTVSSHVNY